MKTRITPRDPPSRRPRGAGHRRLGRRAPPHPGASRRRHRQRGCRCPPCAVGRRPGGGGSTTRLLLEVAVERTADTPLDAGRERTSSTGRRCGCARRTRASAPPSGGPSRTCDTCCSPTPTTRATASRPPARRGTSPSSGGTRSGRRGCPCRSARASRAGRCGRWPAVRAAATTRGRRGAREDPARAARTTFVDPGTSPPPAYYGRSTPRRSGCASCTTPGDGVCPPPTSRPWPGPRAALAGCAGRRQVGRVDPLPRHDRPRAGNQGWKDSGDAMRTPTARWPRAHRPRRDAGLCRRGSAGCGHLFEEVFGSDGARGALGLGADGSRAGRSGSPRWRTAGTRHGARRQGRLVDGWAATWATRWARASDGVRGLPRRGAPQPRTSRARSASEPSRRQSRIQPVGLPHRLGLDPRHRDLCARPRPGGPHAEAARWPPSSSTSPRPRVQLARAFGADPVEGRRPLPRELPAAGVGRGLRRPLVSTLLGLRADLPAGAGGPPLPPPVRCAAGRGDPPGRAPVTVEVDAPARRHGRPRTASRSSCGRLAPGPAQPGPPSGAGAGVAPQHPAPADAGGSHADERHER